MRGFGGRAEPWGGASNKCHPSVAAFGDGLSDDDEERWGVGVFRMGFHKVFF